ncbi:MAG: polysaccharide biosynthesis tyrosine autokinase, partial [Alistipes sp.]|nr:polysaccharide biosynthesis tyrosine autokinase [Alistipes sp.]
MSEINNNATKAQQNESSSFSIHDILKMMTVNWYWFLISVIVCVGCAYLYLASTQNVYIRTATILVKDSRKGGDMDLISFSDLAGFSTRRNVDNEIYILQSRRLMEQVVRELNLTIGYSTRSGLRQNTLYKRSPISVEFINNDETKGSSFAVTILPDNKLSISEFQRKDIEKEESNQVIETIFGDTINTPVGRICITPTFYLSPEYENEEIRVSKSPIGATTNSYRQAVQSSVVNKMSSIITMSMRDVVAQRAEDVLNSLINAYNNDAVEDKRAVAKLTASFINNRLAIISQELGNVDEDIETFKRNNNIYDITAEATRFISESSRYKNEVLSVENQIAMATYIKEYLQDESQSNSLIPATAAVINTAIGKQISDYNEMVLMRNKLSNSSAGNNPTLLNLNNALEASRQSIIASLESHIKALDIQAEAIRREERLANSRIRNASAQEKEILSSIRQQKVKEELYLYLLQKREENELALEVVESNSRIVDSAFGPSLPVYPKTFIILFIAIIFGIGIPFFVIYLLEVLDTTIRGRKDIEENLSIPFLGEIPQYNGEAHRGVVVRENGRDSVSEAFRILRTNMTFMNVGQEKEQKVIMVTSSNPHAGKTFVSTNLAMTMALAGKRVLLVDIDLRRRSLSKLMGHGKDSKGLSTYLSGATKDINDIIKKSSHNENLHMLYAGIQPPNPAEMLLSDSLDRLITELREKFDIIILDSVPALVVADAMIIDRFCDLTLYVVREGLLDRRQLPDIEKFYSEKKFHNMSLILNGTTVKKSGFGYGYGYGYG